MGNFLKRVWILAGAFAIVSSSWMVAPRTARADIEGAPFIPEVDARFNALEQGNHLQSNKFPMGSTDGHWTRQMAQATWDFAKQGGSSTVAALSGYSANGPGNYDLGVSIPKNAVITRSYLYSITQPVPNSAVNVATLGFWCNGGGSNTSLEFKASTVGPGYPVTTSTSVIEGKQTGTAANMSIIATACDLKASIATGNFTAGKVTLFVEYVVHQ